MPWSAVTATCVGWEQVRATLRSNVAEYDFRTWVNDQFPMRVCDDVPAKVRDNVRRPY